MKNFSEVATAAFINEKFRQSKNIHESIEQEQHTFSRRNATNLSDAKICAIFLHQRKLKIKRKFSYKYGYESHRLVMTIYCVLIRQYFSHMKAIITLLYNMTEKLILIIN